MYNTDIPITPAAVVRPSTSDQVADAIKCAVESSVKVQPRGGGHSYANYCEHLLFGLYSSDSFT